MYLELAFGPPPFASPLAVECLGTHYTYSLLCQPQTSVMRLSDGDVLNCNAYAATNEEVDSVMCFPALPNIATDSLLQGTPATFAFHSSEFRNYFPCFPVGAPGQFAYPLVDAFIHYQDGSGRCIALTFCTVRRDLGNGMQSVAGIFAIWHCSNLPYVDIDSSRSIALAAIAQYCAAQFYLTHRPVQLVYRERRTNYGVESSQTFSDTGTTFSNPPVNDPVAYSQLNLIRTIDLNPEPTAQTGTYERKTECWEVVGHWRHLQNGETIWINPYRKGPGRNDPDATPITHEYTIP